MVWHPFFLEPALGQERLYHPVFQREFVLQLLDPRIPFRYLLQHRLLPRKVGLPTRNCLASGMTSPIWMSFLSVTGILPDTMRLMEVVLSPVILEKSAWLPPA